MICCTERVTKLSKAPCITVLVPVKNGQAHLREALSSICSQTFIDFELLIVDDHSTDGTMAICQEFAAADSRVHILTNIGEGLVSGLNTGIEAANCTYIARMDADDISHPQRLERQYNYMLEHQGCDVAGSFMRIFGWNASLGFSGNATTDISFPTKHEDMIKALKCVGSFWVLSHPTVIMRADSVRAVGGYRDRYARAEDLDLWVRMVLSGYRLGNIDEFLLEYRASETSVTSVGRLERYLSTAVLIGNMRDGDNCIECEVDLPLSIDTIGIYGHSETAFERVSDLILLLRGVPPKQRKLLYNHISNRYKSTFDRFPERVLAKALNAKNWPTTINESVVDAIRNTFITFGGV